MSRRLTAFACLALLALHLLPAAVFAQSAQTAERATVQGPTTVLGVKWTCSASRCVASRQAEAIDASAIPACRALAQAVGPLRAFHTGKRKLTAAELAECNKRTPELARIDPKIRITPPAAVASPVKKLVPLPAPLRTPLPAPPPTPPPADASGTRTAFRTPALIVSGTGQVNTQPAFEPMQFRATPSIVVTGTGSLTAAPPFTPMRFRSDPIQVTGTGVTN
jgi:hypothetical protein